MLGQIIWWSGITIEAVILARGLFGKLLKQYPAFLRVFAVCVDAVPPSFLRLSSATSTLSEGLLDHGMARCFGRLCRGV